VDHVTIWRWVQAAAIGIPYITAWASVVKHAGRWDRVPMYSLQNNRQFMESFCSQLITSAANAMR